MPLCMFLTVIAAVLYSKSHPRRFGGTLKETCHITLAGFKLLGIVGKSVINQCCFLSTIMFDDFFSVNSELNQAHRDLKAHLKDEEEV